MEQATGGRTFFRRVVWRWHAFWRERAQPICAGCKRRVYGALPVNEHKACPACLRCMTCGATAEDVNTVVCGG